MPKAYGVRLTDDERRHLVGFTTTGVAAARALRRARMLLLADAGHPDPAIAAAVGCCTNTVANVRRRFAQEGLETALVERRRPGAARLLDGKGEALLVALACTEPPEGEARWTMQLLADRLVALAVVGRVSDETVRRTLKKTSSSPGNARSGASPR